MRRSPHDPLARPLRGFGLSRPVAERLALAGTPVDLPADTALVRRGERGTEAFLILEGEAVVDLGDREITVGPGAVIGELAVLDPFARRNATVRTTEPTLVLVYDVQTFRSLAAADELHALLAPARDIPSAA